MFYTLSFPFSQNTHLQCSSFNQYLFAFLSCHLNFINALTSSPLLISSRFSTFIYLGHPSKSLISLYLVLYLAFLILSSSSFLWITIKSIIILDEDEQMCVEMQILKNISKIVYYISVLISHIIFLFNKFERFKEIKIMYNYMYNLKLSEYMLKIL